MTRVQLKKKENIDNVWEYYLQGGQINYRDRHSHPHDILSYVQTDATTLNIVGPTIVGVVTSVLAVVCKRMQQLPTMLEHAVHLGKDSTHKNMETMCNVLAWPQQCLKSCANGYKICCAPLRWSRNKRSEGSCWPKRLTGFKPCSTTPNKTQQHATAFANNVGTCWPTMLHLFARGFSNYSKSARGKTELLLDPFLAAITVVLVCWIF